jgi:hypothetical protein
MEVRDGRVRAKITVEKADTLDMMRNDSRALERALQDAGLSTSEEDLEFSLKDDGRGYDGDGEGRGGFADKGGAEGDETAEGGNGPPPLGQWVGADGRVDVRL